MQVFGMAKRARKTEEKGDFRQSYGKVGSIDDAAKRFP